MSHLLGGILGGVAFGLLSGLLLGSCVFKGGPNTAAVSGMAAMPPAGMGGGQAPAGMDPGGSSMEGVFAQIAQLKQAIERNPQDRAALVELGNLYYDVNKHAEATVYYERAVALDRSDPNILTDLANSYMFQGNNTKALELLHEVQQRFPAHWQSAANLFYLSSSTGDTATARAALESLKKSNPGFPKIPEMERSLQDPGGGGR